MEFITANYHPPLRLALSAIAAVALLAVPLASCGGAQSVSCNQNDMTRTGPSYQGCFVSNDPVDAVVAAGFAAAAWAVVGCTVNGCMPPYRCNPQTKLCESIDCDESSHCPAAYECNLVTHECQ